MRARVLIRPKAGILDPQGIAVERALPALGFTGVSNVHVGRLLELDVDDPSDLDAMCRRLLSNPLIEGYEILGARAGLGPAPSASPAPATRATPRARASPRAGRVPAW